MMTLTNNAITPLTALSNGALLFVFPLLINLIRNSISILKKGEYF